MPCPDCGMKIGAIPKTQSRPIHPFLDRTELGLQAAWATETTPEHRLLVKELIKAVQSLKNPYTVPLELQLVNLLEISCSVGAEIPCGKCRKAWRWDVAANIQIRLLLERGKRRQAAWLYIKKEFGGKYWLLRALPSLLHSKKRV